jgi:serine/threonine protein kinase
MGEPFGLAGHLLDGQYRVERPIGEGGFSVVYKGMHQGLGEPIAIKCLKLTASLDTEGIETFTRRFRDEGRLLYRLGQGNLDIVRVIIAGTTVAPLTGALVPYMVLEWLEGQPLSVDMRARRDQKLRGRSLDEMIALFEPGVMALDHAHKQGVVHRDVKPANLFLAASQMYGVRMKVLDFGLAKILDDTIGITLAATVGSFMMCSPRYAAPEQFDPKIGPIGAWTDVYSLAIVLLEALRDERVRKSDGIVACMSEAVDPRVNLSASALGMQLPRGIEAALARAVNIDVRQRQRSAGELWGEIKAGMREAPVIRSRPPAIDPALAAEPSTRSPASLHDTIVDPVFSVPQTGLGGTLFMENAPQRPSVPQATPADGRTSRPSGSPSYLPPGYVPVNAYQPSPSNPPPAGSNPPLGPQVGPQVIRAPHPLPARRPSRAPLVIFVVLLLLGGLGAGGFFGWRWWVVHHAVSAVPSPPEG